jgi:hypothetical protein
MVGGSSDDVEEALPDAEAVLPTGDAGPLTAPFVLHPAATAQTATAAHAAQRARRPRRRPGIPLTPRL